MKKYIVFDFGGSSIKCGLLTEDSAILETESFFTPKTTIAFWKNIKDVIWNYRERHEIEGIAISSPGAVDVTTGIVGGASAIPYIHGPNFKSVLNELTGLNVEIENDANCAALAEVWQGAAQDYNDVAFFVCGSGLGGSIVKQKKIHHGANLHGGEFGYCIIDGTGEAKILSQLGSTGGLVNNVAQRKKIDSNLINGLHIFTLAEQGDTICREEIDRFYYYLAIGIYNIQYIFDPEIIVLGGAISERADIIARLNEKLDELLAKVQIAKVRPFITTCTFKNNANLIGALYHYLSIA